MAAVRKNLPIILLIGAMIAALGLLLFPATVPAQGGTRRIYEIGWITVAFFVMAIALMWIAKGELAGAKVRKGAAILGNLMLLVLATLYLTAYLTVGDFDPAAFLRLCFVDVDSVVERTYDRSEIMEATAETPKEDGNAYVETYYELRPDGSAYSEFKDILLWGIRDEVLSLTVTYDKSIPANLYTSSVYFWNKDQEIKRTRYAPEFLFGGENTGKTIWMDIPYCEHFRLDYAQTATSGGSIHDNSLIFQQVIINNKNEIAKIQSTIPIKLVVAFIALALGDFLILLCKKRKLAERIYEKKCQSNFSVEKEFLIWGLLIGIVFLVMMPIGQAPDEDAHLQQISNELKYFGLVEGSDSIKTIWKPIYGKKLDVHDYASSMSQPFASPIIRTGLPSLRILRHLPQSLGIQVGIWLGLPAFWVVMAGRIGGLLFYLGCGFITLRLMPYKKQAMLFLMVNPMIMQLAASLSYDCVVLAMSFLLTAYILYLRERDEICSWSELLIMICMSVPILMTKPNYLIIDALILTIPIEKWRFRVGKRVVCFDREMLYRNRWKLIILMIVGLGAVLAVLSRTRPGALLTAFLLNPADAAKLVCNTISHHYKFYIESAFSKFGWLDASAPRHVTFLLIGMTVLVSLTNECDSDGNQLKRKDNLFFKLVIGVAFFVGIYTCLISMFNWTLQILWLEKGHTVYDLMKQMSALLATSIGRIDGVQGRYFLPLLPLGVLLIPDCKRLKICNVDFARMVSECVMATTVAVFFSNRYWNI